MTISQSRNKAILLGGLVAILVVTFGLPACSAVDSDPVSRVESGLLPLFARKDQLGVRSDIEKRMLHYGVPGVSVAVFENGKIEWAKGYGIARPNEAVPVTESTLFQAASISKSVTSQQHTAWGYRPGLGPVIGGSHLYPEMAAAGLWTTASALSDDNLFITGFPFPPFRTVSGEAGFQIQFPRPK